MNSLKFSFLIFIFVSCGDDKIHNIDTEINTQIEFIFNSNDEHSWQELETSFLIYLSPDDKIETESVNIRYMYNYICNVASYGGIPIELEISDSLVTDKILTDLNRIGFLKNNKFDHNFIYQNYNPIVNKYLRTNSEEADSPKDLLIGMGLKDPKNNDFNLSLISREICDTYTPNDLKRPGLYKSIIMLYYGYLLNDKLKH